MSTTIISNFAPFGAMTNQTITRLNTLRGMLERLDGAIATASSGFEGVPGTQFEGSATGPSSTPNLFGVQASNTPGEQGSAYRFAMDRLNEEWGKFWTVAEPFVRQIDNGSTAAGL